MKTMTAFFVFAALVSSSAHGVDKELGEEAALLYKPYIDCVAEKSYYFSSGPDAASDIAIAAMQACEDMEKDAYSTSLKLKSGGDFLNIPTADRYREYVAQTARKVAISVVIQNRARLPDQSSR